VNISNIMPLFILTFIIFEILIFTNTWFFVSVSGQEVELKYKQQIGSKGTSEGQFMYPHSLAIDNDGNIYVGDTGNKRIQKFSSNGTFLKSWGSEGSDDGQFLGLHDVAVDPTNKFSSNGTFIEKWGFNGTGGRDSQRTPHQLAINTLGNIYLTDPRGNQILKFSNNDSFLGTMGSKGVEPGKFNSPHGIAFDSNNNLYLTDMKNFRIQIFDNGGKFIRQWGSFGNGTGQFSLTAPGIAVDSDSSRVFVLDKLRALVQVFDNHGKYLGEVGTPGTGPGQFKRPEDIAIDNKGTIYVTDTRNSRIQVFQIIP
jgi:DNA-binding beta-propeller fold protein YncE